LVGASVSVTPVSTFLSLGIITLTLRDTLFIVTYSQYYGDGKCCNSKSAGGGTVDEEGNIFVTHAERPDSHQRLSFSVNCKDFSPRRQASYLSPFVYFQTSAITIRHVQATHFHTLLTSFYQCKTPTTVYLWQRSNFNS
jgi:hypothetical protein